MPHGDVKRSKNFIKNTLAYLSASIIIWYGPNSNDAAAGELIMSPDSSNGSLSLDL